jgi:serine/threonine protein phosphatase PrpC
VRAGRTAARSDRGRKRLRNEDAHICDAPLFAVADGMGGAQAGELASRLAATALEERRRGERGEETVASLVREANARVYRRAVEDPAASGMGTTVTVALLDEQAGTMAIGHVGDSRAYRIRDGVLEQLTADHSLVAELVRSGQLTEEEASVHPHRAVITRALGTEPDVEVDTLTVDLREGDLYLLCSDGLTTMVSNDEVLAAAVATEGDPERLAARLVDAANDAGGEDNITVVVFEIVEGDPPARSETDTATAAATGDGRPDRPLEDRAPAPSGAAVSRFGAGHGSRWLALALIVATIAVAALVLYWGLLR